MRKSNLILLSLAMIPMAADAKVVLPAYMTDNMIVQQNDTITIKGRALPGSNVKVVAGWNSTPVSVTADTDGRFVTRIATPPAGGPYALSVGDKDGDILLENILSGEVWLCSGQSNMEFPVQGWTTVMGYDREVATAHHPDIRLLQVRKTTAFSPQEDVRVNGGGWQICSSASMADFSAIAYFFARELSEKLNVPIGVIDATWGGTPAEAWTSVKGLEGVPGFEAECADLAASGYDADKLSRLYEQRINEWMKLAMSTPEGFEVSQLPTPDSWKSITAPGYFDRSELPGFDGVVWLQRSIDIPEDKAGKSLALHFDAIDDEDETYFNGRLVGKGSGFNTPRDYVVDGNNVHAGKNIIMVKVSDFGGEGGIAPGRCDATVDGLVISLGGEWKYLVQRDFSQLPPKPVSPDGSSYPSVLYNAMISPLKDMPVKGVLWYQGCANVGRDEQYAPLFKSLIKDWRKLWGEGVPFYFVQLAGFLKPKAVQPDSQWAALRNAQSKALELDNTAMAVAIDLGNPVDIHPKNKQEVAHRLALVALNRDYGDDCVYAAPRCTEIKRSGNSLILKFDSPIKATSSAVTGFIIAGKDGVFTTATPVLLDDVTLSVSAYGIDRPAAVRYNWADYPGGNLYGVTGLPVAPFANDR